MARQSGAFRKKKVYFTQVSNAALRDEKISLKAKGLYALIQSYITLEDFTLYKAFLLKQCKEGKDAFNSAWNELKKSGYLVQYKLQDEKGLVVYEYELLDTPPHTENPSMDNPHIETPQTLGNSLNPHTDFPYTEKSPYGSSTTGKGGMYNNTNLNNTDINNTNNTQPQEKDAVVVPQTLLDSYIRCFDSKPSSLVQSSLRTYLRKFELDCIEMAFETAGGKGKGYDYARGILKRWDSMNLHTFDEVFEYEENYVNIK